MLLFSKIILFSCISDMSSYFIFFGKCHAQYTLIVRGTVLWFNKKTNIKWLYVLEWTVNGNKLHRTN